MVATLAYHYGWSHADTCSLTWRQACFYHDELARLLGQDDDRHRVSDFEIPPGGVLER